MIGYGKMTQSAIAALSRLAQVYDGGRTRLSSADIAAARNLSKPTVAKLMTILAQAGIVAGSPGPGGGYALARSPEQITFYDVATLFDRLDDERICPFGKGWCGKNAPCPLHEQVASLKERVRSFLLTTTIAVFSGTGDAAGDVARASRP